jgi:hypothetical protein
MGKIVQFGDRIQYRRLGDGVCEEGYCIGAVRYADTVLLIARDDVPGMPIDAERCEVDSTGHHLIAQRLRERYESISPGQLKSDSELGVN